MIGWLLKHHSQTRLQSSKASHRQSWRASQELNESGAVLRLHLRYVLQQHPKCFRLLVVAVRSINKLSQAVYIGPLLLVLKERGLPAHQRIDFHLRIKRVQNIHWQQSFETFAERINLRLNRIIECRLQDEVDVKL